MKQLFIRPVLSHLGRGFQRAPVAHGMHCLAVQKHPVLFSSWDLNLPHLACFYSNSVTGRALVWRQCNMAKKSPQNKGNIKLFQKGALFFFQDSFLWLRLIMHLYLNLFSFINENLAPQRSVWDFRSYWRWTQLPMHWL